MKNNGISQLSPAELEQVSGGVITNPWNPGFWTQGLGGGGSSGGRGGGTIRGPLSGDVNQNINPTICMPGSICNITVVRGPKLPRVK